MNEPNEHFLNTLRQPPPPEFAARLYERISQPMFSQPERPTARLAGASQAGLVAAACAGVCLAALLLFPPARAFAGSIIQHIGGYGFTTDPAQVVPVDKSGQGLVGVDKTQTSVSVQVVGKVPSAQSAAEASRLAGFRVLAPTYLPAGYISMSAWYVGEQANGRIVTTGYRSGNHFFMLNEWQAGNSPSENYARDTIVDVSVRGQPGVWLPSPPGGEGGKNALVWAENGITYSLISDTLGLDEMEKVAEGLGK
jgi:hypothetical protein